MTKNTESTGTTVGAVLLSGGLGIKLRLNVGGKVVVVKPTRHLGVLR